MRVPRRVAAAPGSLHLRSLPPPVVRTEDGFAAPQCSGSSVELSLSKLAHDRSRDAALVRSWLRNTRPPACLALEAVGSYAMLRALKALSGAGTLRTKPRFVPVWFEFPPPAPEDEQAQRSAHPGRPVRGIRFFFAKASQAPGAAEEGSAEALAARSWPMRVSANTGVEGLARAVFSERKLRSEPVPVVLEASCSRRHALVICQALATAQQLAFQERKENVRLSCTVHVTNVSAEGPPVAPARRSGGEGWHCPECALVNAPGCRRCVVCGCEPEGQLSGRVVLERPRLLRVFVWPSAYA